MTNWYFRISLTVQLVTWYFLPFNLTGFSIRWDLFVNLNPKCSNPLYFYLYTVLFAESHILSYHSLWSVVPVPRYGGTFKLEIHFPPMQNDELIGDYTPGLIYRWRVDRAQKVVLVLPLKSEIFTPVELANRVVRVPKKIKERKVVELVKNFAPLMIRYLWTYLEMCHSVCNSMTKLTVPIFDVDRIEHERFVRRNLE